MDKNIIIVILIAVVCVLCGVLVGGALNNHTEVIVVNETHNITNTVDNSTDDSVDSDNSEPTKTGQSSSKPSDNGYKYSHQYGWYKETPNSIIDSEGNVLPREEDKW